MNDRFIVSLDPSYTRTGICILDLLNKNIYNKVREIKNLTIIVDETLF